MREIGSKTTTIGELNVALDRTFDTGYWTFLFARIAYPEIVFNPATGDVTYPEFVPLEDLVRDAVDGLGASEIVTCAVCRRYFALDEEDGIFGDPVRLERFICRACSESLSARDYYRNYLNVRA